MKRGTTPTITLTVTNEDGSACDLTGNTNYLTFHLSGGDAADDLEKTGTDISAEAVDDATVFEVTLTQAETLDWPEGGTVEIQLRSKDGSGNAVATNITTLEVERILKDGEI